MNERVFELRKTLKLTQKAFGRKIGISESAVSSMESGRYNISDTVFKLMCQNFNVSAEWLRTGNGEMFVMSDDAFIKLLREKGHDDLTCRITKSYLELPKSSRDVFNQELLKLASAITADATADAPQGDVTDEQPAAFENDDELRAQAKKEAAQMAAKLEEEIYNEKRRVQSVSTLRESSAV